MSANLLPCKYHFVTFSSVGRVVVFTAPQFALIVKRDEAKTRFFLASKGASRGPPHKPAHAVAAYRFLTEGQDAARATRVESWGGCPALALSAADSSATYRDNIVLV